MISVRQAHIGRTAELRRLRLAWDRSGPGRPAVAGVEGPAGIGKTELIRAFVRSLPPGVTVRAAHGSAGFELPFQVMAGLTGASIDAAADPFLLGRRLATTLSGPVVLVVDDADLADARSLTALRHALAAARGRVLLLLAHRSHDRVAFFPDLEPVRLGGLTVEEVAELGGLSPEGRRLPAEAARRLHEHTSGNPLFALQVLQRVTARELADGVGLPLVSDDERPGPEDEVRRRLAAAGPGAADDVFAIARETYRGGAVHLAAQYRRAALELVPRSSPDRGARLLETVEALLVSGDEAGAAAFAAEVAALPAGSWRDYVTGYLRRLQGDVAGASSSLDAALVGSPEPFAPVDLQARIHTQLAVLATVSLDQAGMSSHGARAIGLSDDPVLTSYAWFAWTVGLALGGDPDRALRELASSPTLRGNLDALAARGLIRLWTGDLDGASGDLREVVERATRGEALRIAQAFAYLSEVRYRQGRLDDAIRLARWAIDDAEQNGRVWAYALVNALAVHPLAARGRFTEAAECASTASTFASTDVGRAYAVGAWVAIAQARPDPPARLLALARELDAAGVAALEPGMHLFAGLTAEASVAPVEPVVLPMRDSARMTSLRAQGVVSLRAADPSAAVSSLFAALALAEAGGLPLEAVKIRLPLARALDALGRRREAAEVLRAALAQASSMSAAAYEAQVSAALAARAPSTHEVLAVLTGRQRAVAELALDGLTRRQIADRLDRSLKVVEGHFTAIFKRLGISSTAELREMFGR